MIQPATLKKDVCGVATRAVLLGFPKVLFALATNQVRPFFVVGGVVAAVVAAVVLILKLLELVKLAVVAVVIATRVLL